MNNQTDHSLLLHPAYLDGVFLAVNAIPDVALVVDSPGCVLMKAGRLQGNHDRNADLLNTIRPRIFHSQAEIEALMAGDDGGLRGAIRSACETPGISAVLVTGSATSSLVGRELLPAGLRETAKTPLWEVSSRELYGDWLDGYDLTLQSIAKNMEFGDIRKEKAAVALVGHLMDRNEADGRSDVRELERMLRAVGLDPVSVWGSGRDLEHLKQAARAETVLSLPFGRKAAKTLAKRTGARLLERNLPLGIEATGRFLQGLTEVTESKAEIEAFLYAERRRILPMLTHAVESAIEDRRFFFAGAPAILAELVEFTQYFGGTVAGCLCTAAVGPKEEKRLKSLGIPIHERPTEKTTTALFDEARREVGSFICLGDGIIGGIAGKLGGIPIEIGYPSFLTHFLRSSPILGFEGVLNLAERISNAVGQARLMDRTAF